MMVLVMALLLTACAEDRPPAPTSEENRQLDEADAMLNEAGDEGGAAIPEICKMHAPYDDSKYDEWRRRALEAGCDKSGNDETNVSPPSAGADTSP